MCWLLPPNLNCSLCRIQLYLSGGSVASFTRGYAACVYVNINIVHYIRKKALCVIKIIVVGSIHT